jgi:phage host-nuclease inhibitor protein Gam
MEEIEKELEKLKRELEELKRELLKICDIEKEQLNILSEIAKMAGVSIYYRNKITTLEEEISRK